MLPILENFFPENMGLFFYPTADQSFIIYVCLPNHEWKYLAKLLCLLQLHKSPHQPHSPYIMSMFCPPMPMQQQTNRFDSHRSVVLIIPDSLPFALLRRVFVPCIEYLNLHVSGQDSTDEEKNFLFGCFISL